MSLLPLTRTCCLTDYPACPTVAHWQQHLVEEAYQRWWPSPEPDLHAEHLLLNLSEGAFLLMPEIAQAFHSFTTPEGFARYTPSVEVASVVALAIVDHIAAPLGFLKMAAGDLRPGGLLVLTFAYWDAEGRDIAVGHAQRRRIYDRISWRRLATESERYDLHLFGGVDWTYGGHTLGDHTLASLVLVKGARP